MFSIPGSWEWIIIGLVVFIIFGRKLSPMMRSLGRNFGEFKKGVKDVEENIKEVKLIKDDIDSVRDFKRNFTG